MARNEPITPETEIVENRRALVTAKLISFRGRGKPKSIEELRERIDSVLMWCGEHDIIPSIEMLSAAIGVTTRTFQRWCNGLYCSETWKDICLEARQTVIAALEFATIDNKVTAPVGIFLLKAHGYSDTRSLEETAMTRTVSDETESYRMPDEIIEELLLSEPKEASTDDLSRAEGHEKELLEIWDWQEEEPNPEMNKYVRGYNA